MKMKKLAVFAVATALSTGSVMTASAAWLQEGSNWRYQNDNGTFQTGTWFKDADGVWYHFDGNGSMQKGWFQDSDGKWYFLAYSGAMQIGLIKVDDRVYYMNPSGDLFLGDMTISGISYNFGLYGTTDGQPNVAQTATFGGNGNQSLNYGGGGGTGDNGGGSGTNANSPEVEAAIREVKDTADAINRESAAAHVKVTEAGKCKVHVSADAKADLDLTDRNQFDDLNNAINKAFDAVIKNSDDKKAVVLAYNGRTGIEVGEGQDLSVYLNQSNFDNNKGKSVDVKVSVNGEDVIYNIKLNK